MIKVKMNDSERARLKNASPQEKQEAFSATVKWVSGEMIHRGLSRDHGPLSDRAMCGKASVEIAKMAYCNKQTLFVLFFVKLFVHFARQFQRLSARVFDVMIKPDIGPSYNHSYEDYTSIIG